MIFLTELILAFFLMHGDVHVHIHVRVRVRLCVRMRLSVCVSVCVCVCDRVGVLCVLEGEEGGSGGDGDGGGGWVLCLSFPPQCPSGQLKLNSFQVERILEGSGTCCSRPILKLEICNIQWFLSVNLSSK